MLGTAEASPLVNVNYLAAVTLYCSVQTCRIMACWIQQKKVGTVREYFAPNTNTAQMRYMLLVSSISKRNYTNA